MSIAFCFLTYDEITRPDVWEKYFENVDPKKYSIHVHPKIQQEIRNQKLFCDKILPVTCDTEWGSFSLVAAQHLLFSAALGTNTNIYPIKYAILVSHNTIPIQSFDKLYSYLDPLILKNMSVMHVDIPHTDQINRYNTLNNPNFTKDAFAFQSQWCILSISDLNIVVNEYDKIKEIFEKSDVPDEHAYINYLTHYKNKSVIMNATTYVKRYSSNQTIVNNESQHYDNSVQIHYTLPQNFILSLRQTNVFFIRKISKKSRLDIDFLLDTKTKLTKPTKPTEFKLVNKFDKKEGISFIVKVRNEEDYLEASIMSLYKLTIPHEIIIILHLCTDNSLNIVQKLVKINSNIKYYTYDVEISRAGYETLATDECCEHSIQTYHNWCLNKTSYTWCFKWDADFWASNNLLQYLNNNVWGKKNKTIGITVRAADFSQSEPYLMDSLHCYKKYLFWEVPFYNKQVEVEQLNEDVYIETCPLNVVKKYWLSIPWYEKEQANVADIADATLVKERMKKLIRDFGPEPIGMARASNPECTNIFKAVFNAKPSYVNFYC